MKFLKAFALKLIKEFKFFSEPISTANLPSGRFFYKLKGSSVKF
jgi:hypothetical protein